MTSSETLHLASGPSSVISGGHGTLCGINTDVVTILPNAHPPLESAETRMNARVMSRKRATGREKEEGNIEKGHQSSCQ